MNVLFVIPARGGSKRLPGKNLETVGGVNLTQRAIDRARRALKLLGCDGEVVLSTDCRDIAKECGAPRLRMRPAPLGGDAAPSAAVVLDVLEWMYPGEAQPDLVCLVQPTSPLATGADVAAVVGLAKTEAGEYWSAYSVSDRTYNANGAAYAQSPQLLRERHNFLQGRTYAMPPQRSIDVDTAFDLHMARAAHEWNLANPQRYDAYGAPYPYKQPAGM